MMKKFGKLFLGMATAAAVLTASAALASAATISGVSAGVSSDEGRPITVTVTYESPEAAQQSTLLVVPQTATLAELTDDDIKYIDQVSVDGNTATYEFKLLEADRTGTYNVYVGGTAVDAPSSTTLSFDTRKIVGTLQLLGHNETATVVAKDASGAEVATAKPDTTGAYSLEVNQGTYDVVLGKAGYFYKTFEDVTVAADQVQLDPVTLVGGDLDGSGEIDLDDLGLVLQNYKGSVADYDLDGNSEIDLDDLGEILKNYKITKDTAYSAK